jgi:hypothetical protein
MRVLVLGLLGWLGVLTGFGAERVPGLVALIGGSQLVAASEAGYLETYYVLREQGKGTRFRNLSWEGDTVFARPRPLNYPGLDQQLKSIGATAVLMQFGQMESLAGEAGVEEFENAYETLIQDVRKVVPQVVLLTPTPFGEGGPLDAAAVAGRNRNLRLYINAVERIGTRQDLRVINVFGNQGEPPFPWRTEDGVQPTPDSQRAIAAWIALFDLADRRGSLVAEYTVQPGGKDVEALREAVIAKNKIWFRYSRPTNWAFLAGDRTEQASSRDHRDRSIRWFPQEMEEFVPLLQAAEVEIAQRAAALRQKSISQ